MYKNRFGIDKLQLLMSHKTKLFAQSAGAVEYTNCFYAEG